MADISIIGGGPAGLMAAEFLATSGHAVTLYERKPTLGRKFLMAGRGGLNLTHSEALAVFLSRYGAAENFLAPVLRDFPPEALRKWSEDLGQPTFVGSSGRVFPESFKASPLLRAWISRLENYGVRFVLQQQWSGWDETGNLVFSGNALNPAAKPAAVLLALGGASWPKLGSDGGWVDILRQRNVPVSSLRPSNCGFSVPWSPFFRERFAGHPLKTITLSFAGKTVPGDMMIAQNGVEGGAVYALSAPVRNALDAGEAASLLVNLRPGLTHEALLQKLQVPPGRQSFSTRLKKSAGLSPVAIGLLREVDCNIQNRTADELAGLIRNLPLGVTAPFPIARAISSAGGIMLDALDDNFMLKAIPSVFAAGEMLDWEAPTGGYLLQATFATARAAAQGIDRWLRR